MKPNSNAVASSGHLRPDGLPVLPAPTFGRRICPGSQAGAATVEFALIALFAFLPLLLGIVELGRLFYVATTTQEVTRRAARAQVVNWIDQRSAVQRYAVFREADSTTATLPGGPEIASTSVRLAFFPTYADALNETNAITNGSPESNLANCIKNDGSPCIRYVRASLETAGGGQVFYQPVTGWFEKLFRVPLPGATVIMPAEALGLL